MEKVKFVPLVLLIACVFKALIAGGAATDVGIMSVLALLTAFYEFHPTAKALAECKKSIEMQNVAIENTYKEMQQLKTFVNSMKMNQISQVRPSNGKSSITF